jgi:curli biogenesis system outer membrane secretion channel CsgG
MNSYAKVMSTVVFLFFCLPQISFSAIKDYTVSAEGYGDTQEVALREALSKALAQVTGAEISTNSSIASMMAETEVEASGSRESVSTIGVVQKTSSSVKTDGYIKSYQIDSESLDGDQMFVVRVTAVIPKYEAEASSNRKRIALTQTKVLSGSRLFDIRNSSELRDMVDQAIESNLVQSRKFSVLSRRNLSDMTKELDLIASDSVTRSEKAKLGQLLGGDFILIPEVADANAYMAERYVQATGQTLVSPKGGMTLNLKVISVATGEIKFSDTYTARANEHPSSLGLIDTIARRAVSDLVARIYPARVVGLAGNEVILNFGGDTIRPGALYRVYKAGEKLVDPYTGESLGSSQQDVALIEVVRVEAKISYAQIIDGGGITNGMMVKLDRSGRAKAVRAAPVEAKPKKKGITLPF